MKGIEFRIEKTSAQIESILMKPQVKPTLDIFWINFAKYAIQCLQIAQVIINQCDLEKHIITMFQLLSSKIKQSKKFKPEVEEDDNQIQTGDDQITKFLNSRRAVHPSKNTAELGWYINHMQKKQKDTQNFIEQVNKLKNHSLICQETKKNQKVQKQTQSDIIWVDKLQFDEGSQLSHENLLESIPLSLQKNNKKIRELEQKLQQYQIKSYQTAQKIQLPKAEDMELQQQNKTIDMTSNKSSKNQVPKNKKKRDSISNFKKINNMKLSKNKRSLVQSSNFGLGNKQQKQYQSAISTPTNLMQKNSIVKEAVQREKKQQSQNIISNEDQQINDDNIIEISQKSIKKLDKTMFSHQDHPKNQIIQIQTFNQNLNHNQASKQTVLQSQQESKLRESSYQKMTKTQGSNECHTKIQQIDNYAGRTNAFNLYPTIENRDLPISKNRFLSINQSKQQQEEERPSTKLKNESMTQRDISQTMYFAFNHGKNFKTDDKKIMDKKTINSNQKMIQIRSGIQETKLTKLYTVHKESNIKNLFQDNFKINKQEKQNLVLRSTGSQYFDEKYKIKTMQNRFNTKVKPIFYKQNIENLPNIYRNKKIVNIKSEINQSNQKDNMREKEKQKNFNQHELQLFDNQNYQLYKDVQRQEDLLKRDALILNKMQQLHRTQKLSQNQFKFYVEIMEKMHRKFCGRQCKHLERFYKQLKINNIWNHRIPYALHTRKIGFFN